MKGNDAAKRATIAISNTLFFWRRWREPGRESAGRKEMKEIFEANGTALRSLIQNVSDVIIILEADGTIRYDSPAIESVLGYWPGERVGTSGFGYVHPEDLERVRATFAEALGKPGVQPPIEFRIRHKDGSWRHVETTRNNLLDDPNVRGVVTTLRDVTERKRAEEALKESEERYRAVMEQSVETIYLYDADTKCVLESNAAFQRMMGYTAEELRKMRIYDFIAHEKENIDVNVRRSLKEKRRHIGERRYRRKDGSIIIVDTSASVISYRGKTALCAVSRDVTELRRAEEKLRQQAALLDLSHEPILTWELDGSIIYWNRGCEELYGFSREAAVGRISHRLLQTVYPMPLEQFKATLERDGQWVGELRQTAHDGRQIIVESRHMLVRAADGRRLVLETNRDVTERKRVEDKLREAERRYRTLVERIPAVTYMQEATGVNAVTYTSPQMENMLGYSPEECTSDPDHWIKILHPADRERVLAEDRRTNEAGEPFSMEYRQFAKDGRVVWIRDEATLVRDEAGNPLYWLGVQTDITERKQAEEALKESELRLRTVITNVPVVLFVLDHAGVFILSEGKGLGVLGLEPGEVVGRSVSELYGDKPEILEDVDRALSGEEFSAIREVNSQTFETWYSPLRASTGEVSGAIGLATDVTERKRAEEMRARLARQAELRADVSAALAESGTLQSTLQRCTEAMVKHLGAAFARVWTLNEEESVLELRASAGMYTHTDGPHGRVPVGELKIGLIAQERQPHLTNTVTSDPRLSDKEWAEREGMVAFAGYPLIVEDRLVGVMAMFAREALVEDTIEALASVADVIAQGIERKRAEEALRGSEKSLAEAQQIAHIGNWEYEVEKNRARWSGEMYRIFGFSSGEFVPTYKAFLGLVHPDDKAFVRRSVREALRSGKRRSIEYRIVRPDGAVRCIHTEYEALRGESGKPKRLIGTVHDITERKRAEEEIGRLSHYNRTLFEANLAALMTLDAEGTITDVNRSTEEITGFSREKLIGTDIFSHFEDPQRARDWFREVMSEGAVRGYELDIRDSAGRTTPVAYNATVYRDERGEVAGVLASARDITDRRQAEEALKESEERYRRLVELSPELIAIHSEGKLVYVNAAGAELLGARSPEELIGKPVLDFVHPDYVETAKARIRQIREEGKPTDLIEEKLVRLDGQVIDVEVAATPFTYLGKPATQVIARDITERKRVEEEIKEANQRLEELAVLKADFTAMVAHELDTPLAVIRGYTDMLSTGELGPNDQDRALARIQDETDVLDTLIADVRAAATVEREDFDIKPKRVPVGVLLEDAVTFVETLSGNHPLVTEIAADGQVLADPYRIGQVLRNLLSNAAKYSPDGAPIELRAVPGEKAGHVRIEVTDRGTGIHPDDAARIFEKFGRGRDSSGRKVVGVGLGLYLSRRILQAHGGELTLDPAPGGGSMFGFELKAVR